MEEQYEVTIIMSNYNQERYISDAIESVLSQKVKFKYKLIIADDYSCDDDSKKIILDYSRKYDNIEIIFADYNGGYLTNILRAKSKVQSKYFCLLDADDYWTDNSFLQRAYEFLESHDSFSVYEANVNVAYIDEDGCICKLSPFLSAKYKSGTYSKEMLLTNQTVPITQTTGMFLRNCIFINGIPEIMLNAVGTRSEHSFEGDRGRFIMHIKEGFAYYDNTIVGVYRITQMGIWSRINRAEKYLISAHTYIDYYRYYQSNADFFVTKSYQTFQLYLLEKLRQFKNASWQDRFISEYEKVMIDDIYQFCKNHEYDIVVDKMGMKAKIKQIIKIIIA